MRVKYCACSLILIALTALSVFSQVPLSFERDRGITILNLIKGDLKKNYYDPNFHGMDVEARFKQAEEKIKAATNQNQMFGIIAQALIDLDDSHTFFVPPVRPFTLEYGWKMQIIGERCFVVAVKPGSDAEAKGLKEGDEIYTIDGFGPVRQNLWKIQYKYQALSPRGGMSLVVIKPDGKQEQLDVMAKITQGKRIIDLTSSDVFDLIRQQENEERLNRHRYYELKDALTIWKMPGFDLSPEKVDDIVGQARKRKALIIDLRGNGGGYEQTLLRLIGNVFDHDVKLGDIKRRKETKPLIAKTRGSDAFSGKLIVLIDSQSASAAELFARVVQLEKRGVVLGDVSSGAVMRAKTYDHDLGLDTKIFYAASITDADIIMSDGRSLEHVGVTPDQILLPTPPALAAKLDPVLAYAASLAGVAIPPDKAGALFPVEWRK
jgi:carboxyl-terminal processing protease